VVDSENMAGWQIYINGYFYGYNSELIQINTNDTLKIVAAKDWDGAVGSITLSVNLL
jgi:hypothetical protein